MNPERRSECVRTEARRIDHECAPAVQDQEGEGAVGARLPLSRCRREAAPVHDDEGASHRLARDRENAAPDLAARAEKIVAVDTSRDGDHLVMGLDEIAQLDPDHDLAGLEALDTEAPLGVGTALERDIPGVVTPDLYLRAGHESAGTVAHGANEHRRRSRRRAASLPCGHRRPARGRAPQQPEHRHGGQ